MWSNFAPHDNVACHVDKNCSTWQSILHHVTKLLVMWSNFIMLSNEKLLHIWKLDQFTFKIAPHDKFTMCAVFLWFTLFWRNISFVAIYALLCGVKILSVEQKWQIWCMHLSISQPLGNLSGGVFPNRSLLSAVYGYIAQHLKKWPPFAVFSECKCHGIVVEHISGQRKMSKLFLDQEDQDWVFPIKQHPLYGAVAPSN